MLSNPAGRGAAHIEKRIIEYRSEWRIGKNRAPIRINYRYCTA